MKNNPNIIWQDYPEAQQRLSERLGLFWKNDVQDWDLINTNPANIEYWLQFYEKLEDAEEKYSLMQLIVASFDDYQHYKSFDLELWNQCTDILVREHFSLIPIIYYWSASSGTTFFLSDYMDEVYNQVKQYYE